MTKNKMDEAIEEESSKAIEKTMCESMEVDVVKNFQERSPVTVPDVQPGNILELAIKQNMTAEQISQLWEIQEKIDASIAKKAFVAAMAKFKKERIIIKKDKKNNQFHGSKYSSIDATVNTTVPFLGRHGFSHGWEYGKEGNNIVVTCILTHEGGHSESVTADGEPDLGQKSSKGNFAKNQLQAVKSTRTYLKIETFEAVTGLVSSENNCDDDGNSSSMQCISEDQALEIEGMIKDLNEQERPWLDWLGGFGSVRTIPAKKYKQMIAALKARAK